MRVTMRTPLNRPIHTHEKSLNLGDPKRGYALWSACRRELTAGSSNTTTDWTGGLGKINKVNCDGV